MRSLFRSPSFCVFLANNVELSVSQLTLRVCERERGREEDRC